MTSATHACNTCIHMNKFFCMTHETYLQGRAFPALQWRSFAWPFFCPCHLLDVALKMAGGKKGGRKAAAEAAAHSAGRRKASAVELSADNEARVRSALAVSSATQY